MCVFLFLTSRNTCSVFWSQYFVQYNIISIITIKKVIISTFLPLTFFFYFRTTERSGPCLPQASVLTGFCLQQYVSPPCSSKQHPFITLFLRLSKKLPSSDMPLWYTIRDQTLLFSGFLRMQTVGCLWRTYRFLRFCFPPPYTAFLNGTYYSSQRFPSSRFFLLEFMSPWRCV